MERGAVIEQADHKRRMIIRPNPALGSVGVQLTGALPGGGSLEIIDVNGRIRKTVVLSAKENTTEIETSGLANGNYFCRLVHNGKTLAIAKFSILR